MSTLYVMISIADRSRLPRFQSVFQNNGVDLNLIAMGRGTAPNDVLDVLGIGSVEKAFCISVVDEVKWRAMRKEFRTRIGIDAPGVGIAFIIPLASVGGRRALDLLTMGMDYQKEEESALKETKHELIITVCEQGYSETVMEAARKGGAFGGTILHAKGTGQKKAEQFLGISLAAEKDVLMIVAESAVKAEIMRNIIKEAGMDTRAKAVAFSLPVTEAIGLRITEDDA